MPQLIQHLTWSRQFRARLDEICKTLASLLTDLAGTPQLVSKTQEVEGLGGWEKEK